MANLKIIGGEKRGFPLAFPRGSGLRPTSSRVREAFFDILAGEIEESRFLDLFAGSGAMGIEALSRGAAESWFVEEDRANVRAIQQNLETCGFQGWGSVLRDRLPGCLSRLESQGRFEIVFVDPPYEGEVGAAVLAELGSGKLLAPAAWVVMEHRKTESLPLRHGSLQHRRTARYGDSALSFYRIP